MEWFKARYLKYYSPVIHTEYVTVAFAVDSSRCLDKDTKRILKQRYFNEFET